MNDASPFEYLVANPPGLDPLREAINAHYHADETEVVQQLLGVAALDRDGADRVARRARDLVAAVRARKADQGALEAFMQEYDLSSEEGVVLMCL